MFIWIAPVFLICCWKWGDWKNWKIYYPTILYFILIDFLTNFLTAHYPLWTFKNSLINHTFSDIFVAFTIFPSTVMLYLPHYPKKVFKQALYLLFWVFLYSLAEFVSMKLGTFSYDNGWNIWWSIGFNLFLFIMLKVHYKYPIAAWPISGVLIVVTLTMIFKLPITGMR